MNRLAGLLALALLIGGGGGGGGIARASGLQQACEPPPDLSAAEQDRLFRFGSIVRARLEASGRRLALVARSGLDLGRFNVRYSHAGVSLKASTETPWAVRQLYYACDEGQPRLFDQGMLGFVLGTHEPSLGYVSALLLPPEAEADVERLALDKHLALQLLGGRYSANAYAFSAQYQNCNQWVAELLATARGGLANGVEGEGQGGSALRQRAQAWLQDQGYRPSVFDVGWRPLMWAPAFVSWLHNEDHPAADLDAKRYRVSMPASIEAFVQATLPGAMRLEICHNAAQVVVRRGWAPIAEGCIAGPGDEVVALD